MGLKGGMGRRGRLESKKEGVIDRDTMTEIGNRSGEWAAKLITTYIQYNDQHKKTPAVLLTDHPPLIHSHVQAPSSYSSMCL